MNDDHETATRQNAIKTHELGEYGNATVEIWLFENGEFRYHFEAERSFDISDSEMEQLEADAIEWVSEHV